MYSIMLELSKQLEVKFFSLYINYIKQITSFVPNINKKECEITLFLTEQNSVTFFHLLEVLRVLGNVLVLLDALVYQNYLVYAHDLCPAVEYLFVLQRH